MLISLRVPSVQALSAMTGNRHASAADLANVPPPPTAQLPPTGLRTFSGSSQAAQPQPMAPQAMDAPPLGGGFATGLQTPYSR